MREQRSLEFQTFLAVVSRRMRHPPPPSFSSSRVFLSLILIPLAPSCHLFCSVNEFLLLLVTQATASLDSKSGKTPATLFGSRVSPDDPITRVKDPNILRPAVAFFSFPLFYDWCWFFIFSPSFTRSHSSLPFSLHQSVNLDPDNFPLKLWS